MGAQWHATTWSGRAATRPYDTARRPCDKVGLPVGRATACARAAWLLGCVVIQSFVS